MVKRLALAAALLVGAIAPIACNVQVGKEGGALRPNERPARPIYSPEWTYKQAYVAWQVNHNTIITELERASYPRNNLLIRSAAEDAGWSLLTMQANLPEGKGKELDPIIEGYKAIGEKAMQQISTGVLQSKLRKLRSQVTKGFAPDLVPIVAPREE